VSFSLVATAGRERTKRVRLAPAFVPVRGFFEVLFAPVALSSSPLRCLFLDSDIAAVSLLLCGEWLNAGDFLNHSLPQILIFNPKKKKLQRKVLAAH